MNQINQQITAATMRLNLSIEMAVLNALSSLGLPVSNSNVELAKKQLAEESPLYVKTISIRGDLCQDMYEDHPGHTLKPT